MYHLVLTLAAFWVGRDIAMVSKKQSKKNEKGLGNAFLKGLPDPLSRGCLILVGIISTGLHAQHQPKAPANTNSEKKAPAAAEPAPAPTPDTEAATPDGKASTPDDIQRNRRFTFDEDEMAETLFRYGSFSFHPGASYSVSYNDNIFAGRSTGSTPIKSKDDILHRFMVDIAGSFFTGNTDDFTIPLASYQPEYMLYTKNSDRNAINHSGSLSALKLFPRTSISLGHTSSSRQGVFAETATNERQISHNTMLTIHYDLGGKTTLESESSQRLLKSSSFLETKEWREDLWMNYQFLPKVGAAIGTSGGYSLVSMGGAHWVHADQVRLTYLPTEKLTFGLRGGYEWRFAADDQAKDSTGFIAGFTAGYRVAKFTDLNLIVDRTLRPSIYLANETALYNTAALSVKQTISERFFASLTGSYALVQIEAEGRGAARDPDYAFYSSQIEGGYSITKRARSSVFYRLTGRSGGDLGGFTSNEVGMTLNYHF